MQNYKDNDAFLARFALTLRLTWHYLLILAGLFAFCLKTVPILATLPAVLFVFVLFFFRNPKRKIPQDAGLFLSPAEGTIMEIDQVYEDRFVKENTIRVAIFLSIFNVHINRSPLSGEVMYSYYRPGKFIPAFKSHASEINEKNYIGIDSDGIKILVCQITGFIARRINCWVKKGSFLSAGDYLGIIRFGSASEIFLPPETRILVKKGDQVKAGETIIGVLPEDFFDKNAAAHTG